MHFRWRGRLLPTGHNDRVPVEMSPEEFDALVEEVLGLGQEVAAEVALLAFGEVNLAVEDLAAQRVHTLALLVHDVVVFEQVLADREVLVFNLLLRALDGARHHAVLDRHALFHAEPLHQARDAVRAEDAHQVIFERQEEARRAGVALAAGASAQLVVDAPRLVTFSADDMQAAEVHNFLVLFVGLALEVPEDAIPVGALDAIEAVDVEEIHPLVVVDVLFLALRDLLGDALIETLLARHVLGIAAQQDVRSAAGHVGGDGDAALAAGLRDDLGFLRVILRVQHDVLQALALEHVRHAL